MTDKSQKLLLYPQITQIAQIFSGCGVDISRAAGRNTKSAKHTAG